MVIGAALNEGSRIKYALSPANSGLPVEVWEAISAGIFFGSVIFLLYKWDKDISGTARISQIRFVIIKKSSGASCRSGVLVACSFSGAQVGGKACVY
jgi:hypothetical protein